ncbi:MAG: hypothetical protein RL065_170 [Bacteroidota bacterium]|jgi:hypothetical protein
MKKSILLLSALVVFSNTLFAQKRRPSNEVEEPEEKVEYRVYKKPTQKLIYPNKIFCFYPLAAIAGNFKIGLERKLSENTSIKTNVRIGFADESNFYKYDKNTNNYVNYYNSYTYTNTSSLRNLFNSMLELQYRYYFSDKAPQSFYGGLYGFYKNTTFTYTETVTTTTGQYPYQLNSASSTVRSPFINGGGLGILVGNQFVSKSKIACDFYMGSGMFFATQNGKYFKGMNGVADRYFNGIGFILGANIGLAVGQ